MIKIKNIFRGIKNWFKAEIKCSIYKKAIKQQDKEIEELRETIEDLKKENENLQFELDRDDKQQRINYLEKRIEEFFVIRRSLRDEIKELKEKKKWRTT